MLHCIILGSCCLCIRNLTALTHSIPDNVNSSRVNTLLRTLSMKYPTCICIPLHKTFLWKKWSCFSMVSTVCSWMQSTFCLSELSVLQAVTILVAMASRKKFWRLKLLWKSPNWRPVFSYHVPSFPFFCLKLYEPCVYSTLFMLCNCTGPVNCNCLWVVANCCFLVSKSITCH